MVSFIDADPSKFAHTATIAPWLRARAGSYLASLGCRKGRHWVRQDANTIDNDLYRFRRAGDAMVLHLWASAQPSWPFESFRWRLIFKLHAKGLILRQQSRDWQP